MAWYLTGFVSTERRLPSPPPYQARNWMATLAPAFQIRTHSEPANWGHGIVGGREVLIQASRDDIAERAYALNKATFCAVRRRSEFGPPTVDERELTRAGSLAECRRLEMREMDHFLRTSGFLKACELAAKATQRRSTVYALTKYRVGVDFGKMSE